ncbi:MAG: signal peptide peptidase SppA [bacterium]
MKKKHITIFIISTLSILLLCFFITLIVFFVLNKEGIFASNKIALINITGVITESEDIIKQIQKYEYNETVKAVIVRIDSPGGAVAPSQEIYEALKKLQKEKKVVVSMGNIAASGGYYVACLADKIFANLGTITGSIGVIMQFYNVETLLKDRIGLQSLVIKSGRYKDIGSPTREMNEEEKVILQSLIDDVYEQFISAVAEGRKMDKERVREIADGRIFSGNQAKKLHLVDETGTLQDAINYTAKLVNIVGTPKIITEKKKKISIFNLTDSLFNKYIGNTFNSSPISISYLFAMGIK